MWNDSQSEDRTQKSRIRRGREQPAREGTDKAEGSYDALAYIRHILSRVCCTCRIKRQKIGTNGDRSSSRHAAQSDLSFCVPSRRMRPEPSAYSRRPRSAQGLEIYFHISPEQGNAPGGLGDTFPERTLNVCLLLSERDDWIHGGRPPSRNVGRNQSDEGQYQRQQNKRNQRLRTGSIEERSNCS